MFSNKNVFCILGGYLRVMFADCKIESLEQKSPPNKVAFIEMTVDVIEIGLNKN